MSAYTEAGAQRLAAMWCHRMQALLSVWRQSGCADTYEFSAEDVESYEEPPAGVDLPVEAALAFRRRLDTIRALRPK